MMTKRILIVDDQDVNLYMLRTLLHGHGYDVEEARHGAEALEKARALPPDLIISDILMPVMDGFALCRAVKTDAVLRSIPFIFYTATYTDARDQEFALSLGADRFLVKPTEFDNLLAVIHDTTETAQRCTGEDALPATTAADMPDTLASTEVGTLKSYNEVLIRKLESKMEQLERSNRELAQDIARRIRTEEALQQSELKLRTLLDTSPFPIALMNVHTGEVLFWSQSAQRIFGHVPANTEEWFCLAYPDLSLRQAAIDRWTPFITMARELSTPVNCGEYLITCADGCERTCEIYTTVIGDDMIITFADITARLQAEFALQQKNEELEQYFSNSLDLLCISDTNGHFRRLNPQWEQVLGYTLEELESVAFLDLVHPDDVTATLAVMSQLRDQQDVKSFENRYRCKDGRYRNIEWRSRPNGETVYSAARDVTDRIQAEEELAEEKERLAVTLRSIGDGVIATDRDNRIVLLNRVAEEITGWTSAEALGRPVADVLRLLEEDTLEPLDDPVQQVLAGDGALITIEECLLITRDGGERIIADSAAPIRDRDSRVVGVVLVFRDITGESHLRQEIQRMAKLDSLGVMAGGIAHDFNNLLTTIVGNLELAQLGLGAPTEENVRQLLAEAETAALRARHLTQQLLTFAKGGEPVRGTVELLPLLREAVSLALTGSNCRSQIEAPESLWPVHADAGQLSQVINNLLLNATQAMPDGGIVRVNVVNIYVTSAVHLPLPAGPYLRIDVVDTGMGIPVDLQEIIFDPFFTTKQHAHGLGLASAHSIIRGHEGHISVASTAGRGSTFSVFLPARPQETVKTEDATDTHNGIPPLRILVLDDETSIGALLKRVLEAAGHQVTLVEDGNSAIDAWRQAMADGQRFQLGIFDLTIPGGLGGKDTLAEIQRSDPTARAIASSGYATDAIMANYHQYGFVERLAKPYRMQEVLALIEKLHDAQDA